MYSYPYPRIASLVAAILFAGCAEVSSVGAPSASPGASPSQTTTSAGISLPRLPSAPSSAAPASLIPSSLASAPVPESSSPSAEPVVAPSSLSSPAAVSVPVDPLPSFVPVTKVVDGDTFDVLLDGKTERIRLIGIDTPETVDPRKPVQCFGVEASKTAKALLTGKRVRLESDPTQDDRDVYGRLLRYAYVEDGPFFNEYTIAQGYAHEYTYEIPYQFQQAFRDAERAARETGRGLWAEDACPLSPVAAAASAAPAAVHTSTPLTSTIGSADGHTWYASSFRTAKYYYCDTDPGWQALNPVNLLSFPSEEAARERFPSYALHAPCG